MPSRPNMASLPNRQSPSYQTSPGLSRGDTPLVFQAGRDSCRAMLNNGKLEQPYSYRSLSLKETIPRRLPETELYARTSSHESNPEEANKDSLAFLSSKILELTLNPESSLPSSSQATIDHTPMHSPLNANCPTSCAGHHEACFTPYQRGDTTGSANSVTAERDSQPSNSSPESAIVTRATKRRKRNSTSDGNHEEEEGAGDDDGQTPSGETELSPSKGPMACPYRKRDETKFNIHNYPNCTKSFADMTAVKQHLIKMHMLPALEPTSNDGKSFEYGINQYVEKQLKGRENDKKINKWHKLWVLLFNEDTNIPSSDYVPCHIFELYETKAMMRQFANQTGSPVQGATDSTINNIQSAYLTGRNVEVHVTAAPKQKRRGKQKASSLNTGTQAIVSQQATGDRFRKLAPRAANHNSPARSQDSATAEDDGSLPPNSASIHALPEPATNRGSSYILSSPAGPVRRSVRLAPQTAHSDYPPVPELWNSFQQFPQYETGFVWSSNADHVEEDPNGHNNQG
ncbi:hypothetical protein QBC41DRAFT_230586 [Cercophora samala]|uniref:C2H2-type domain-containing protein n=1 Tax=Cercophora samala TaxID=330535 RepID=A0AA39Z910_9PEZI|nr:hypothetical protein QBC41DRAFT_230586 [Cercophora samala]